MLACNIVIHAHSNVTKSVRFLLAQKIAWSMMVSLGFLRKFFAMFFLIICGYYIAAPFEIFTCVKIETYQKKSLVDSRILVPKYNFCHELLFYWLFQQVICLDHSLFAAIVREKTGLCKLVRHCYDKIPSH